jgi:hypothetical protein
VFFIVEKIVFDKIDVETIESNSGIFIGKNFATNWDANSKTQNVIGTIQGSNQFEKSAAILYDNDIVDTVIITNDKSVIKSGKQKPTIHNKKKLQKSFKK